VCIFSVSLLINCLCGGKDVWVFFPIRILKNMIIMKEEIGDEGFGVVVCVCLSKEVREIVNNEMCAVAISNML